jgi:hypothetical protein
MNHDENNKLVTPKVLHILRVPSFEIVHCCDKNFIYRDRSRQKKAKKRATIRLPYDLVGQGDCARSPRENDEHEKTLRCS